MTFTARPTTYKGIPMRSRLEAGFAQSLDNTVSRRPWLYEPRAYANEHGQYLPDFHIPEADEFYEIKPSSAPPPVLSAALARMHIIRASVPEARLVVAVGHWLPGIDFDYPIYCFPDWSKYCPTCTPKFKLLFEAA